MLIGGKPIKIKNMKQICTIIQGPESTLFNRVLLYLQRAGVSRRYLQEYEKAEGKPLEELLDISYKFLTESGYYL
jgi:uncharacterized protein YukJ